MFLAVNVFAVGIGPFVAGIIAQWSSWRYVYMVMAVWGTGTFILHLIVVPETLNKAEGRNSALAALAALEDRGELISVTLLLSIASGFLFLVYLMIGTLFPFNYKLQPIAIGCIYTLTGIAVGLGAAIGTVISWLLRKKFDFGGSLILPIIVSLLLAFGSVVLGWSLAGSSIYLPLSVVLLSACVRGSVIPGLQIGRAHV